MVDNLAWNKDVALKLENEDIIEDVFADVFTTAVAIVTAVKDTCPAGYQGVVVSLGCEKVASVKAYLKVADKQRFANGLMTEGFPADNRDVEIMEPIAEKEVWELQFGGAVDTIQYRLRVRYFRK